MVLSPTKLNMLGLLPASVLALLAGGHWTTREWLHTTVSIHGPLTRTAEYADSLQTLLGPMTHWALSDVSDGHVIEGAKNGRALSASGIELQCLVVSDAFEGVARVTRQQRVQSVFHGELQTGQVHALAMRCMTPDEWHKNGSPRTYAEASGKAVFRG